MTYSAVYCALIESRKHSPLSEDQYSEEHHIVPKSEGGSDDKSNLVRLSAREHYIAHLLLAKIYDDQKMYSALIYMQTGRHKSRNFKFNSRLYEKMRKEFKSKISGENHWTYKHPEKVRRGFKYSEQHNKKLSEIGKTKVGKLNNFYGRRHSEKTKKILSEKHHKFWAGRPKPWLRGKKLSDYHKQKDREALLGMKFWNNGKISVRARSCPEGFVPGRLKKKSSEN